MFVIIILSIHLCFSDYFAILMMNQHNIFLRKLINHISYFFNITYLVLGGDCIHRHFVLLYHLHHVIFSIKSNRSECKTTRRQTHFSHIIRGNTLLYKWKGGFSTLFSYNLSNARNTSP